MVMVKAPAYRAQVFLGPVEIDALVVNKQISQNDAAVLRSKQIKFKVVEGEVQSKIGRYPKFPEQQSVQRIFGRFFGHLLKMLPAGLGDGQRQIR